ncbi:hypothetical protein RE6C_01757 [Rhodopirellula europaea 6C]|uniref:Uncharacterized protein n=1 Tax=Rhodopirellula europaea 6C TaxID=1263867 RepID=M2A7R0_9BACT|nr:hypothetical protein RE6C_01757 [Rhodopirellula europaea 6C]
MSRLHVGQCSLQKNRSKRQRDHLMSFGMSMLAIEATPTSVELPSVSSSDSNSA